MFGFNKVKDIIEKNKKGESFAESDGLNLEKGDGWAIAISAMLVFFPIFAVLGLICYLVF